MSSIFWKKGSLIQRVGNHEAKLGYVAFDPSTKTHVLWLKDPNEEEARYIRGDEFSSLAEAKDKAAGAVTVSIFHYLWLSRLRGEDQNRPPGPGNPFISARLPPSQPARYGSAPISEPPPLPEPASDASAPVVQPRPLPEEVGAWLLKMTSGPQGSSLEVRIPPGRLRRIWQWVKTWMWFGSS